MDIKGIWIYGYLGYIWILRGYGYILLDKGFQSTGINRPCISLIGGSFKLTLTTIPLNLR